MTFQLSSKPPQPAPLALSATAAFSHVVLETRSAPAGSAYKAVFQVGHGCQGSATTAHHR